MYEGEGITLGSTMKPRERLEAIAISPVDYDWTKIPVSTLISTLDKIKAALPSTSLAEIDLEQELLTQYHSTRELQSLVIDDESIPVNQKAQVANTVAATLQKLVDLQTVVYTQERWKKLEGLVIKTMMGQPEDLVMQFLFDYETRINKANL